MASGRTSEGGSLLWPLSYGNSVTSISQTITEPHDSAHKDDTHPRLCPPLRPCRQNTAQISSPRMHRRLAPSWLVRSGVVRSGCEYAYAETICRCLIFCLVTTLARLHFLPTTTATTKRRGATRLGARSDCAFGDQGGEAHALSSMSRRIGGSLDSLAPRVLHWVRLFGPLLFHSSPKANRRTLVACRLRRVASCIAVGVLTLLLRGRR